MLTNEDVILLTPIFSKSLIIVTRDEVLPCYEGDYGGFILSFNSIGKKFSKEELEALLKNSRVYFVTPRWEDYNGNVNKVDEVLASLPEEVREVFSDTQDYVYKRLLTLEYVLVKPVILKVRSRYAVLDMAPFRRTYKYHAKIVVLKKHYSYSREAAKVLKEWRVKYPQNKYIAKYMKTAIPPEGGSNLYLLVPVRVPHRLAVQPLIEVSKETPVLINGFLVISRLPSKALLDTHLPEIFKNVKVGTKQVKLVMGYFYNQLGVLSRKYYNTILPKYAVNAGFGYILPKEAVADFLDEIDALKNEYMKYERRLKNFLTTGEVPEELRNNKRAKLYREYLDIIREYLKKYGKEEDFRRLVEEIRIASRVNITLLPFSVNMAVLEEFIDESVKERIEKELLEYRKQMEKAIKKKTREVVRDVMKKLKSMAKKKYTEEQLEHLRKEVTRIEKMILNMGLDVPPELEDLKYMLSDEGIQKLAEAELDKEVSDKRLKALLQF